MDKKKGTYMLVEYLSVTDAKHTFLHVYVCYLRTLSLTSSLCNYISLIYPITVQFYHILNCNLNHLL